MDSCEAAISRDPEPHPGSKSRLGLSASTHLAITLPISIGVKYCPRSRLSPFGIAISNAVPITSDPSVHALLPTAIPNFSSTLSNAARDVSSDPRFHRICTLSTSPIAASFGADTSTNLCSAEGETRLNFVAIDLELIGNKKVCL